MTFTLRIKLGNDAMRDGIDLAVVLRGVARDLQERGEDLDGAGEAIMDFNGNRVGEWTVIE